MWCCRRWQAGRGRLHARQSPDSRPVVEVGAETGKNSLYPRGGENSAVGQSRSRERASGHADERGSAERARYSLPSRRERPQWCSPVICSVDQEPALARPDACCDPAESCAPRAVQRARAGRPARSAGPRRHDMPRCSRGATPAATRRCCRGSGIHATSSIGSPGRGRRGPMHLSHNR